MPEKCFLCSARDILCCADGRKIGEKALETIKKAAESRNDVLISNALFHEKSIWVANICYKRYTDHRNFHKNSSNKANESLPSITTTNQSFKKRQRASPFCFKTHCLICEVELNFERAKKRPDVSKYQISEVTIVTGKSKECKLHETLKRVVSSRKDPLAMEVAAKLSYASCF